MVKQEFKWTRFIQKLCLNTKKLCTKACCAIPQRRQVWRGHENRIKVLLREANDRMISEAVHIQEMPEEHSLNSKAEWTYVKLPWVAIQYHLGTDWGGKFSSRSPPRGYSDWIRRNPTESNQIQWSDSVGVASGLVPIVLKLHAKFRKDHMTSFREKLQTGRMDERTNKHGSFYRPNLLCWWVQKLELNIIGPKEGSESLLT